MCRNHRCRCQSCPDTGHCPCGASTLKVRVVRKTPAHPYYGQGSELGFAINGIEGATLNLIPGVKYFIDYRDPLSSSHPLYIANNPIGMGVGRISDNITKPEVLVFNDPGAFYYACAAHEWMGGEIFVG